ncbi:hypothetical protein M0G43_02460 [Subsaxibacter sp. CAU 1640]|uniref:hypothetical protein n=1 Tax=Subsaxibacter sp. CAU 1640 TaxID=2933271 RepID=UPI0020031BF9|nr:hypothetical protein [Subsaxibacter sp. CAU 1640]MCK7589428.1 hypothetical protein [Subsaxibacter sp. CAU 1640]
MFKNYVQFLCLLLIATIYSCGNDDGYVSVTDDDPTPVSPVVFEIDQVPYQTLTEYNFFEGDIKNLIPVYGVLPYDLISPLFSDYAHKKRFIWMPSGVSADYVNDFSVLDFPIGTVLIKNFYYDNVQPEGNTRILETRLQIKKQDGWVFANYKWNPDQTQATYDLNGSYVPLDFIDNDTQRSVNYFIPSGSQCLTCHKSENDIGTPIGVKPQNLNRSFSYVDGSMNQLEKWVEMGYLSNSYPSNIETVVDWEDGTKSLEIRARSYLDINCAHCHSDNRHCDYRPVRFAFHESSDITNLGVCVQAHEIFDPALTYIVNPGNSERSIMAVRLNSVAQELRMPLMGRTLKHDEGVLLIEQWINSLTENCN